MSIKNVLFVFLLINVMSGRLQCIIYLFLLLLRCDPTLVMASSFLRFLDHKQRRTTDGRTPLDEWSARRRDLYLTTHNTHNRQTSMPLVGFETHDLRRRTAADLRLTPCGHWDRLRVLLLLCRNVTSFSFTLSHIINHSQ